MKHPPTLPDLRPTERFSDRVEDYARYRPGYPPQVFALLRDELGVAPPAHVVDVGAGTGLFARGLLETGYRVTGVEPNAAMRRAGQRLLAAFEGYRAVDGRAEATGLPDACADVVTAAQAFHWFEPAAARREFARILRPGGWALLVWNQRRCDTPFLRAYETLLVAHCPDYPQIGASHAAEERVAALFAPAGYGQATFAHEQQFDRAGLIGRALSSSYVPISGPRRDAFVGELGALFDAHAESGRVRFGYDTRVFYGKPGPTGP